jgi:hypothetical protein
MRCIVDLKRPEKINETKFCGGFDAIRTVITILEGLTGDVLGDQAAVCIKTHS